MLSPLSEQHRQVLHLYYLEHDQDNDAVADALGIRPGTARVRRFRALEAARKGSSR
jgi:DNA-directed RNA polymerase specialized sigma24 family protein